MRARHDVCGLPHLRHRALGCLVARNQDARGVLQMSFRDRRDAGRKRRREERRLPRGRSGFQDQFQVFRKAHVEHFVGFIKDHRLQTGEVKRSAAKMVERTPGSGHHNVCAALECQDLACEFLSAVNRHHGRAKFLAVLMERFGHLHGEFARGHQDQRERLERHCGRLANPLQKRQRKRRGLTRTGGSLTKQVATLHERHDGRLLDGCGFFVSKCRELGKQFRSKSKLSESVLHRQRIQATAFAGAEGAISACFTSNAPTVQFGLAIPSTPHPEARARARAKTRHSRRAEAAVLQLLH